MKRKTLFRSIKLVLNFPKSIPVGFKLLRDHRINLKNKLFFLMIGFGYLLFPMDLIPDIPIIGQFDDFAIFLLLFNWFIKTIPSSILDEYGWFSDLQKVEQEENL